MSRSEYMTSTEAGIQQFPGFFDHFGLEWVEAVQAWFDKVITQFIHVAAGMNKDLVPGMFATMANDRFRALL
jgi:hypothetical protein